MHYSLWVQNLVASQVLPLAPVKSISLADDDYHEFAQILWDTNYLQLPQHKDNLIKALSIVENPPQEEEEPIKLKTYLAYLPLHQNKNG